MHHRPPYRPFLRTLFAAATLALVATAPARAETPDPANWEAVLDAARGQTVYFHAWGGEPRINAFISWAGDTVKGRHGVSVEQVKVSDTANVDRKSVV